MKKYLTLSILSIIFLSVAPFSIADSVSSTNNTSNSIPVCPSVQSNNLISPGTIVTVSSPWGVVSKCYVGGASATSKITSCNNSVCVTIANSFSRSAWSS